MTTRKWKTELLVNTTTAGDQDQPAVTALADGGFVIAWRDNNPTDSVIRWQRYNAEGNKVGAEITAPANNDTGDVEAPTLVQLSDGNLWLAASDLDATSPGVDFDPRGTVFDLNGTIVRNQNGALNSNNQTTPGVASLGANGSVIVWQEAVPGNADDIRMFIHDAVGGTVLTATTVNNNAGTLAFNQGDPQVAASKDGSKFAVVWRDNGLNIGDIRARVFNANGTEFAAEFTVNSFTSSTQNDPQITWLDNGRFVVSWNHPDPAPAAGGDGSLTSVKYQIVNADGTLFGAERLANSTVIADQFESTITSLPNGGFVMAWQDQSITGGDISSSAIRLQTFDGAGDKVGGEILVNTSTLNSQLSPSLATLADGRVIVTWRDGSLLGTQGADIRAQIIDPRDGSIDGTSAADTLYGHDSVGDVITGFEGADTIYGLAGADTIYGGADVDNVNGGRGDDTVYGDAGADNVWGGLGDDEMFGGTEDDVLNGSGGADLLDGGSGTDTAYYYRSTAGVVVNLLAGTASGGEAAGDVFVSIESLIGSRDFGDNLALSNVAGKIESYGGNDLLTGGSAADTLNGGNDNDVLYGKKGADVLIGGSGFDRFYFATGDSGQAALTADKITDYAKGAVGVGDEIDASVAMTIGGSNAAATATQASINATTGVATFDTGSGTTLADALADITARFTAAANTAGEVAFFRVNATGNMYLFISDGTAGVTANDVLVELQNITTIGSLNFTSGDITILS